MDVGGVITAVVGEVMVTARCGWGYSLGCGWGNGYR